MIDEHGLTYEPSMATTADARAAALESRLAAAEAALSEARAAFEKYCEAADGTSINATAAAWANLIEAMEPAALSRPATESTEAQT